MSELTFAEAEAVANGVLAGAASRGLKPVAVAVLDAGGHVVVAKRQDGATYFRVDIATAKAGTAVALGSASRDFSAMAETRPQFVVSLVNISGGNIVPAAGGVPIQRDGRIIGSVGVSGDLPDNDEAAALDGIAAAGLSND